MVYFVQSVNGGTIKIGTTIRLSIRVPQLEYQYDMKLRILGVRPGGVTEEQALHRKFAHLNSVDEWFYPEKELTRFIQEETVEWDGVDEAQPQASTKIESTVLRDARIVTAVTGEGLAEYLSRVLRPVVARDKEAALEKEQTGLKAKPKKGESR